MAISEGFPRFAFRSRVRVVIFRYTIVNLKHYPMKRITHFYHEYPVVALIVNSIAFFVWAVTLIMIITVIAVAFTG